MYIDNNKEILNFKFVMCVPTHTSQVSFHFNEFFYYSPKDNFWECRALGIFLVNDFYTPQAPPPSINFVHGSYRKCLNLT